jgi:hypothetical protein
MSRLLGLREDQQRGEVLVALINGLFPIDPVRRIRGQAAIPLYLYMPYLPALYFPFVNSSLLQVDRPL